MAPSRNKILPLQGLRFVLFLTVFLFHTTAFPPISDKSMVYHLIYRGGGGLAVAYFFVLSGFVADLSPSCGAIANVKDYCNYILRRAKRFYPYHFLFLLLILPLSRYGFLHDTKNAVVGFFSSLFLIQSWNPNRSIWLGYNGIAWFLSTSLFLTALTPFLYWLTERIPPRIHTRVCCLGIGMCFLGMCAIAGLGRKYGYGYYWVYAFPPARIGDYAAGYFLAEIYKTRASLPVRIRQFLSGNVCAAAVVILYGAYLTAVNHNDDYKWMLFNSAAVFLPGAILTVFSVAAGKNFLSKTLGAEWIVKLGGKTYYYMMAHQVIMRYADSFVEHFVNDKIATQWIFVGLSFAALLISEPIVSKWLKEKVYTKPGGEKS